MHRNVTHQCAGFDSFPSDMPHEYFDNLFAPPIATAQVDPDPGFDAITNEDLFDGIAPWFLLASNDMEPPRASPSIDNIPE